MGFIDNPPEAKLVLGEPVDGYWLSKTEHFFIVPIYWFQNYKTNEVTVDDIISMMVEALENDEDIVESDKTLHASPYGRQDYYNSWPVMRNYIDPKLIIRKLISPYGLTGT